MLVKRFFSERLISTILLLLIGGILGYQMAIEGKLLGIKLPFLKLENKETIYKLSYNGQPSKYKTINFDIFWETWDLLEKKYVNPDDFNFEKMVDGAVAGMVAALDDPYTMYLPEEPKKISEEDLSGSFFGVGIELGYKEKSLAIMAPINNSPAQRAGVQAGDLIVHVKDENEGVDEDTYDWSLERAQKVLRGKKGTEVIMTLFREDYNENKPFEVKIIRDEIIINSVELSFEERAGSQFAYLQLNRFGERTFDEWNLAVSEILLKKGAVKGMILDLRNNPGGYFNESIHVASEFIKDGVVVTQKGRFNSQSYSATGKGRLVGMPLVILINKGSASSSEIVAGALRDNVQAILVGEETFGKGLIQERIDLKNGAGLNVTIAKWMLPSGDWIHDNGLKPDHEIKNDPETEEIDEVVEKAIELLL